MIVTERIEPENPGGWVLIRTYSDAGMMIRQNGTEDLYPEAVDPEFAGRTYTETDIPIDEPDADEMEDFAEAGRILLGVKE